MTSDLPSLIDTVKALDATRKEASDVYHDFVVGHRRGDGTLQMSDEEMATYRRVVNEAHATKDSFDACCLDAAPRLALECERLAAENALLREELSAKISGAKQP